MAWEDLIKSIGAKANADLSALQYHAVKYDPAGSSGEIIGAGAGEAAIGILQDDPTLGRYGSVGILGISKAVFGAAVATPGTKLKVDASSRLVTAGGGDVAVAMSIIPVSKAGVIAPVLLGTVANTGATGLANARAILTFPVTLSQLDNVAIVTNLVPKLIGEVEAIYFVTKTPTTDAADSNCVITLLIGGVALTGGVLTLDVDAAGTDPDTAGKVVAATAITGNNTLAVDSQVTISVADTANAFTDGDGLLVVVVKQ